jgi:hypothetical protein
MTLQFLGRDLESSVRGRHARINCRLQQNFLQIDQLKITGERPLRTCSKPNLLSISLDGHPLCSLSHVEMPRGGAIPCGQAFDDGVSGLYLFEFRASRSV